MFKAGGAISLRPCPHDSVTLFAGMRKNDGDFSF